MTQIQNSFKHSKIRALNLFRIPIFEFRASRREPFSASSRKGSLLVEGILAAALLGMIVASLVGLFIYGQQSTLLAGQRMIATFLAEEGIEAARNIRDETGGFLNLTTGDHGLSAGSTYSFSGTSDTTGIYTRVITISAETLPTRKKIISIVTWTISPSRTGSVSLESHLRSI